MPNFPYSISIGEHRILWHTLAEMLGMFVGFRFYLYLRKKQGDVLPAQNRLIVLIAAILGALAGSRIVGALEDIDQLLQAKSIWLYIFSNKSIAGGLLGGLFAVEFVKYCIGEKRKSGDLFVFPLLLAMVIGRLGCFSMGIHEATFGKATPSIFGMDLGDHVLRHPVMLYEVFFLLCLWIILRLLQKYCPLKPGALFQMFMIAYLLFRFFVEFLKPNKIYFLHLGTIQIACMVGCCYYGLYFLTRSRRSQISVANRKAD